VVYSKRLLGIPRAQRLATHRREGSCLAPIQLSSTAPAGILAADQGEYLESDGGWPGPNDAVAEATVLYLTQVCTVEPARSATAYRSYHMVASSCGLVQVVSAH
jgi:hypothetical protein